MSIVAGLSPTDRQLTPAREQELDDQLRSTRTRIAEVQDRLGEIHRSRSTDLGGLAAQQQGCLIEMAQLQQRLNDLDIGRRGFGPRRRP
jgi:DNA repair exonuclease SbcCD ATPase subunit